MKARLQVQSIWNGYLNFRKGLGIMIDKANTAFVLLSTALVILMTPGLALFYGGLGDRRNVLGIIKQNFVSLGLTTILWFLVGYSLCFSGDIFGLIGNLDKAFLNFNIKEIMESTQIPQVAFAVFQLAFAIITPALITGAFINRVSFKAYLIFLVLWQLIVYYPIAHMVWGGGILAKWGVLDYAGGIVVHPLAGMAGLAAAIYIGKRRYSDPKPHNIPMVALGTGLLWFGWFGFNSGSALQADEIAALAFMNTQLAAAFAATTWMLIDRSSSRIGGYYASRRFCFHVSCYPNWNVCLYRLFWRGDFKK